jgi:sugar lactone lactonase YvrE
MQDLFITSAHNLDAPELDEKYPQRGDLFKVRIEGIKGVERFRFGQ